MIAVKDMMKKAVSTEHDIKLKDAAKIMNKLNIGSLAYIKKDRILGILTERDVIKNINHLDKNISMIATKKVITIDLNKSIDDAADLMGKYKIKRLLVTKNEKLVGIITASELIANSEVLNETSLF